uniref:HTH CENPB-type domain-containing protein n=1 Tax=Pelodiscus sinensis TaxID=13735 RepID=K7GGI5_PELSI
AEKAELMKFGSSAEMSRASEKHRTLHKPKLEISYEWFSLKCSEGAPVTDPVLMEKAKDLYQQMEITETCIFSDGWFACFKIQHGIRKLDVSGEKQSAGHQPLEEFCGLHPTLLKDHGITSEKLYNAGEMGLFWHCLPSSTFAGAGEESSGTKIASLMCVNTAGTHKIKSLVVSKLKLPRLFKGFVHLPVEYKAQLNVWLEKDIFLWCYHIFFSAMKDHLKDLGVPEGPKVILVLDNSHAHSEAELMSGNIFMVFLTKKVTSLSQWIRELFIYRRDFMRKLLNFEGIIQDFQSRCSIKNAVFTVACIWFAVKPTTLKRAWRKLWVEVTFVERSSDEEEFQGFIKRPKRRALQKTLDVLQNG